MAKPFNFYGYSSGIIGSGLTSAYPSNFSGKFYPDGSYSGTYTPEGMYDTPAGYFFGVEDYNVTFGKLSIKQSGSLNTTNLHISNLELSFTGNFFPVLGESGTLLISYTGQIQKDNIDVSNYTTSFTGEVLQQAIDTSNYYVIITGKFPQNTVEIYTLSNVISGAFLPQLADASIYSINLSGNITKYDKDNLSLNIGLDSITWQRGSPAVEEEETDQTIISVGIGYIGWSQLN